jgi:hypothetical protein
VDLEKMLSYVLSLSALVTSRFYLASGTSRAEKKILRKSK